MSRWLRALQGGLHLHVADFGDGEVQVLQRLGRIYVTRPQLCELVLDITPAVVFGSLGRPPEQVSSARGQAVASNGSCSATQEDVSVVTQLGPLG